ncbi:hypothetical protein DCC85_20165 [Paenibacillus sp. CAA11]|uniref:Ig-like domain-containing protein n=1 Tax=Paenibacillus sp. CAA11 TaxID=1532905 RepID=UPI000D3C837F|nr:Ig-like domain-containing protein [Paenibacillus sp. CAA11]AWB46248.1 hypothetical protein DCC85_20165 [Paenibacillus sp. CAA11]
MKKKISCLLALMLTLELMLGVFAYAASSVEDPKFVPANTLPMNQVKGVDPDPAVLQIQLQYDRDLALGTANITLTNLTDNPTAPIYTYSGADINISGSLVKLTGATLDYNKEYRVDIAAGSFMDLNVVNTTPAYSWSFKTLTAKGSKAPQATNYSTSVASPIDLATLGGSLGLKIDFDKPVAGVAGKKIDIIRVADNQKVHSMDAGSLTGQSINLSVPAAVLNRGEAYYVTIETGAFEDADGFPFAGLTHSNGLSWTFSMKGEPVQANPELSPAKGATGIAPGSPLIITFSRPVVRNTGEIQISDGQKIDVATSTSITGEGTNKITIQPQTPLMANKTYTVNVPQGAFKDTEGNSTYAISGWNFTTATQTSTQLAVTNYSPAHRSTNINTSTAPTLTFSNSIKWANNGTSFENGANGVTLRKSGSSALPSAVVTISGTKLIITPRQSLDNGSTYYVDISSGVILDATTNSPYTGLNGSSSWSFSTPSLDKTLPVLQKAQMYSNNTIRLQYDKILSQSTSLYTSNFTVTVNGETRRLSYAYTSGDSVYVVLDLGVAVGQVVRISYTPGSTGAIQDTSSNKAIGFANKEVTNGIDSVLPKPESGYVSGNTLSLRFKESLKSPSGYAPSQFTVTADDATLGISSMTLSGSSVTLYLSNSVPNGAVVKVSYTPGTSPLQDYRGQNIAGFSDFFVRNYNDTKPPELQKVEGSANKIVLIYNEALSTTSVPMKSQYSVLVNNTPNYVTAIDISMNQVTLTLTTPFTSAQTVTVSYVSGTGGVADLNGNLAGYINLQPVNFAAVAQGVRSASINGDTLTIVFNNNLNYSSPALSTRLFHVTVNQVAKELNSATVNGNTVTLKLAAAVSQGQTVELSYMPDYTSPMTDSSGKTVAAISKMPVNNVTNTGTTTSSGSAAGLTQLATSEFGLAGYIIPSSSAVASGTQSRAGQSVNKYIVDSTKLTSALNEVMNSANVNQRNLIFEVPATEKAAFVALPLQPLKEAYMRNNSMKIGVRYGDALYVVALDQIPFTDLSRTQGASFSSNNLWIQLERVAKDKLSVPLSQKGVNLLPIVDPVELYITTGPSSLSTQTLLDLKGSLYVRTGGSVNAGQSSLNKFDNTQRTITFLPTQISRPGSYTVFSGNASKGNLIIGPTTGLANFSDVTDHWAKAAITELASKAILEPRSAGMFQPKQNITRSEFAAAIAKGLGLAPDASSASRFSDVPTSSNIAPYIGAAVKAGIVNGGTDGRFQPGSSITREQMALMMVRAMNAAGYHITLSGTPAQTLSIFKDSKKIGSKDTVAQAVKEGIIQGTSQGTFNPKGTASRAEAAVMIKRVLDKLNYLQ